MLNIIYCSIFVGLLWIPFVNYHSKTYVFSPLQATVTLFNAINALICVWEIALFRHSKLIETVYKKKLKPKYKQRLPPGFVLFDSAPLSKAFSLEHWSQIWSTYSLLDPAYADSRTFQFWVDVGNGHFFLVPTILFSFCISFEYMEEFMSPRNQALIACVCQYVMMHGTFLYYASYIHSGKYKGVSTAGKVVVAFANFLWILFPSIAIYACYHAIQEDSWNVFRSP